MPLNKSHLSYFIIHDALSAILNMFMLPDLDTVRKFGRVPSRFGGSGRDEMAFRNRHDWFKAEIIVPSFRHINGTDEAGASRLCRVTLFAGEELHKHYLRCIYQRWLIKSSINSNSVKPIDSD